MTDREMLEAAATAMDLWPSPEPFEHVLEHWNPLTDDGDALRLAVKLRITLDFGAVSPTIQARVVANMPRKPRWWAKNGPFYESVEYVPEEMWSGREDEIRFADWYMQEYAGMVRGLAAATRRVIVRAAASMQEGAKE